MDGYANSESWRCYRSLLNDRFSIHLDREPIEKWQIIHGHHVHIDEWQPEGHAKGTFILVHGGGGNGRILAPFGKLAANLGWRALAPDLPGYGLTKPAPGFRWEYGEWPAVIAELADTAQVPVVLMGLSVGGMTAAFAAEASPKVAGVIATTLLDMSDPELFTRAARWRWLGAASLLGFRALPWIIDRVAVPLRLAAPMKAMVADAALQDYFANDPLLGRLHVPLRFFRTMHNHNADSIDPGCPLLLIHPGADAWTPTALSLLAFDRLPGPKRLRELSNGSHLPIERPAFDELEDEVHSFLSAILRGRDPLACGPEVEGRGPVGA